MVSQLNPRFLTVYQRVSQVTGGIVVTVGFLVLAGRLFGVSAPEDTFLGVTMKANTALAFMLSGISLWILSARPKNQRIDLLARVCAAFTVLIGVLTLGEYVFGRNFGMDQLLFRDVVTAESTHPGRMSLSGALNFSLLGVALLLLDRHQYRWLGQVFSITALIISLLALMGYAYGVSSLYQFSPAGAMPIHTAVVFSLLCVGILFARPEQGLVKIFSSDNLGGAMARRLVPAALVIPFLLGWLLLMGQRMGLYDSTFRIVLYSVAMVIAFTILIWWNVVQLHHADFVRTAELSQANSLLHTLLDHMPDHIYFKNSESRFIRNSRSQASALGLSDPAEAIGKSDFDFFPHAQLSYEIEQEIMRTGKPLVNQEELVSWPDGQTTWVLTTKLPLFDQTGQVIGTFGISRDITERKQSEVALQKAKLELEAANKELEAFSYSVSHDLRSPLRSLDGFSNALLEDFGDQLPEQGRNYLERIRDSAQRMAGLIDDLLNLSRVTRVQIQFVPVDLTRLAETILAELQQTQVERRVKCSVAPGLGARGDPHLLRIVLENLLGNAWKYTSKQEQAEIEFGSKYENDETIYFVHDNGAGFDMAYANKMFGAFQRLHSTTEFPGTGIGLATVQRIIHRHGGRIWAEGVVNQGATFFFTLPALERTLPKAEQQKEDSIIERAKDII
jgi:PAS domain S-box-containing protein